MANPKKTAAQLDADIAEALRRPPHEVVGALSAVHEKHGRKAVRCKRCKGAGYVNVGTPMQEGCPVCDKLGTVMSHATKKDTGYYVGAELRDDLVREIDALGWEGDDARRAAKIRQSLAEASPHRSGYLFDVGGWGWEDYDFLKMLVDAVAEDMGHTASSRGIGFGNTLIGRQIRALREKL
ncbi:MAG TPA: hypothetical protein VLE97_11550 [Gaiellaceae bacterium]|nr:hypothetical protein [Gaiellaceae bacterium]